MCVVTLGLWLPFYVACAILNAGRYRVVDV
jgi:hypothetical protein